MAQKNDVTLICVLLGDKVSTRGLSGAAYDAVSANRFLEAVSLFTYGFDYLYPESTLDALAARGLPHVLPHRRRTGIVSAC